MEIYSDKDKNSVLKDKKSIFNVPNKREDGEMLLWDIYIYFKITGIW